MRNLCLASLILIILTTTAHARLANGERCVRNQDCSSGYCFPFPDGNRYCIRKSANCALPGSSGVTWGATTNYNGREWECKRGVRGNWASPLSNGEQCTNQRDCSSGYCFPFRPDGNRYCIHARANCALPGSKGLKWDDTTNYNGQTWVCTRGAGWTTLLANGEICNRQQECASGHCALVPGGARYCIHNRYNCAKPGSHGAKWGGVARINGLLHTCTRGRGWYQGVHKKFSEFTNGVGKHRECRQKKCGALDVICQADKAQKKFTCEALKKAEMVQAEPMEAAIHLSRQSALKAGVKPIPNYIRSKLSEFFPKRILDKVRYRVGWTGELDIQRFAFFRNNGAIVFNEVVVFKTHQDAEKNLRLWAHELEHVIQYEMLDVDGFAQMYTIGKKRGKYVKNPHTIEGGAVNREEFVCSWINC